MLWGCCLGVPARVRVCEVDARVQGGMQFGVLVQVVFWSVWGALFEVLVTVCVFARLMLWGCCLGVPARVHVCEIDGRVQGGMQFGVLVQVVFWDAACGAGDGVALLRD